MISSCTSRKTISIPNELARSDFLDPDRLAQREAELRHAMRPAGAMYAGQQHVNVMRGIRDLRLKFGRDFVSLAIVSAGYGLIAEDRSIAPYEVTFNNMTRVEARSWANRLRIPADVRAAAAAHPLVVLLLGGRYLDAIDPPLSPEPSQRFVFLVKPALRPALRVSRVTTVPAGKDQARRWGAGLVALKGRMFSLFARGLVQLGEPVLQEVMGDDTESTFDGIMDVGRASA